MHAWSYIHIIYIYINTYVILYHYNMRLIIIVRFKNTYILFISFYSRTLELKSGKNMSTVVGRSEKENNIKIVYVPII